MKRARGVDQYGDGSGEQPPHKKGSAGGVPRVKDALGYLEKVKQKFHNKPDVYNKFLDIMKDFKSQSIDTEGVIKRVKTLFKGNRNLILGFNQFLPPGYKVDMPAPIEKPPKQPTNEFNHAVKYVAKIKNRFRDQPNIYGQFLDILHDYQAKRTIDEVYARVQKLFGNQPDLLDEFKYFLPDNNAPPLIPNKRSSKSKVKKKDKDKPTRSYKRRKPKEDEKKDYSMPSPLGGKKDKPRNVTYPQGTQRELMLFEKMKAAVHKNTWSQFLKALHLYANDIISRTELVRMVEDIMGSKYADLATRFKTVIDFEDWEETQWATRKQNNYYAYVQSVDFKTCEQPTPSYRIIPNDVPVPPSSFRSRLCEETLNDRCISIPTGSEDFSFKATRKNIYEENLFKVEDERFELDMLIENVASAIRVLKPIQDRIEKLPVEEANQMRLPKTLDILHIRTIARVYGESGYEAIKMLKAQPARAIPVILRRLNQKLLEWRRVKLENKSQWRRVMEQNYAKSLDHRSFYFKQEDKKRLTTKALMTDLRTRHAKMIGRIDDQDEDDRRQAPEFLGFTAPKEPLYTYCMGYQFQDLEIHQHIFDVLCHVVRSTCSKEEQERVLGFWTNFVHHVFGLAVTPGMKVYNSKEAPPADEAMEDDATPRTRQMLPEIPAEKKEEKLDVKPLKVRMDTWEIEEKLNPIRRHQRPSRLFFGNQHYYVFFRLHQFLFQRLLKAKELSMRWRQKLSSKRRKRRKRAFPETPEAVYEEFKQILLELLDNRLDPGKFEDELRVLLGARSYILFTIDKLVSQMIRQINLIVSSETGQKLLELYKLQEKRETKNLSPEACAQHAYMYFSQASSLTGDDECPQVEFFEDTNTLGIGLAEGMSSPEYSSISLQSTDYLDTFFQTPAAMDNSEQAAENGFTRPIMFRNVRAFGASLRTALKNTEVSNNLESMVEASTFKMYYLDPSEDVFIRHKKKTKPDYKSTIIREQSKQAVGKLFKKVFPEQDPSDVGPILSIEDPNAAALDAAAALTLTASKVGKAEAPEPNSDAKVSQEDSEKFLQSINDFQAAARRIDDHSQDMSDDDQDPDADGEGDGDADVDGEDEDDEGLDDLMGGMNDDGSDESDNVQ